MSETTNLKLFKHDNPSTNENQFNVESALNENWDKIDDAYGKLDINKADKTDVQEIEQDISDIKTEQTTQNDLLERTQSALINITTEKSSSINVQDCSNLPAKMNVFGISEQKTRSGKNKLKLINSNNTSAGLNWQTTEDEVKISGTATSGYSSSNEFECPTIPAGTYKFLAGEVSNLTYRIWLYNNQNQLIKYPASGEEFTLTEDVVKYRLIFDNLTTGNTYNASFKPMILESTEEDESFEQYGASPSPEYKSDIENVEGNVDITVCNKNLFNCLKWLKMNHSAGYPVAITDNTNTAIEIIKETKNSIKYNQKSAYYGVLSEYIPVKKGQIFTLSFNYININRLFVTQYDKDKTRIKELNNTGNVNTTTFTVEQDGFITIAFSYSNATPNENTIEITNIQLEVGTVKTDYIENEQQTITFPLQEGQKLYKGDYLADDGIHHVRKQKLITGEEALWTYYSANDIWARPYVQIDDKKIGESNNTANALCNKAKSISWEDMAAGLNEYAVFTYEGDRRINISVKKEDLKTQDIDGVKKYFQENNMVVEYNLEEEEIEPYTEEQQEAYNQLQNAQSYYNVTNVFTDKAQLVFKYIADTQTWVLNKLNNINQELLNIAGGN